jgi:hypothetical protein
MNRPATLAAQPEIKSFCFFFFRKRRILFLKKKKQKNLRYFAVVLIDPTLPDSLRVAKPAAHSPSNMPLSMLHAQ